MTPGSRRVTGACAVALLAAVLVLGPATATPAGPPAAPRPVMAFADRLHGFAAGAGGILRTVDGGRSWRPLRAPSGLQALCATRAGAWIARRGVVWLRAPGGWRPALRARLDRGGEGPVPELGCRGRSAWALFHRAAAAGSEGYDVFRSLDGGRTWRAVLGNLDPLRPRLPLLAPRAGPFAVIDGGAAVLVGFCPACGRGTVTVASTVDGGLAWRRSTPLEGYAPADVAFADRKRGWLLTTSPAGSHAAGLIWATADGGRSWRLVLRSPVLTAAPP